MWSHSNDDDVSEQNGVETTDVSSGVTSQDDKDDEWSGKWWRNDVEQNQCCFVLMWWVVNDVSNKIRSVYNENKCRDINYTWIIDLVVKDSSSYMIKMFTYFVHSYFDNV